MRYRPHDVAIEWARSRKRVRGMGAAIFAGGLLLLGAGVQVQRASSVMRAFGMGGKELLQLLRSIEGGAVNQEYLGYEMAILVHFAGAFWYLVMLAVVVFSVWLARRWRRSEEIVWGYVEQMERERGHSSETVERGSENEPV